MNLSRCLIFIIVSTSLFLVFSCSSAASTYAMGQENVDSIDYPTTCGQKHWTDSTKKLTDKPYEGGPQYLKIFLKRLNYRAEESGWTELTKN